MICVWNNSQVESDEEVQENHRRGMIPVRLIPCFSLHIQFQWYGWGLKILPGAWPEIWPIFLTFMEDEEW